MNLVEDHPVIISIMLQFHRSSSFWREIIEMMTVWQGGPLPTFLFLCGSEIQNGRHQAIYFTIEPYGNFIEKLILVLNTRKIITFCIFNCRRKFLWSRFFWFHVFQRYPRLTHCTWYFQDEKEKYSPLKSKMAVTRRFILPLNPMGISLKIEAHGTLWEFVLSCSFQKVPSQLTWFVPWVGRGPPCQTVIISI
jgi:hypothetical protein